MSRVEVTNIAVNGLWLLLDDREVFLNVLRPSPHHLHWPDLDVDLSTESIDHSKKFPLVSALRGRTT